MMIFCIAGIQGWQILAMYCWHTGCLRVRIGFDWRGGAGLLGWRGGYHVSRHGENHVPRHVGFLHTLVASYALTRYVADAGKGVLSFRTDISNLCMTPTGAMHSAVSDD